MICDYGWGLIMIMVVMVVIVMMMAVFVMVWPKPRRIIGKKASVRCGFTAIEHFLDQSLVDLRIAGSQLGIDLPIEVFSTIDPSLFAA